VQIGGARHRSVDFSVTSPKRAFRRALLVQRYTPQKATNNLIDFLKQLRPVLDEQLEDLLREHHGIKFWISVEVSYRRILDETRASGNFTTKSTALHNSFEITNTLDKLDEDVLQRHANFLRTSSGFTVDSVESATLHAARFTPLAGSGFKTLPRFLALKKCIVNVQNTDNRCFGYSLLAALEPANGARNRASRYDLHFAKHGLDEIQYPVSPNEVPAIEDKVHININVFSFFDDEGKGRYPLYASKKANDRSVDLLYWHGHYALITSFERFLSDITKSHTQKLICRQCFGHFKSEDALTTHQLFCSRPNFITTIYLLPPPDTELRFKNVRYQQRTPFVIYADCECICAPHEKEVKSTRFYTHHVACSIGFKLVTHVPQLAGEPYKVHTGPDVTSWFMAQMRSLERRCTAYLFDDQRLEMTNADWHDLHAAVKCYLCDRPLGTDRVRDHDHITGRYRGAAHSKCNLALRKTYKIPVFFHNFRGYDSHIIVWGLRKYPGSDISLIGQGMEKYLTLGWGDHLVFKDSLQFLASSLETLCANLLRSGKEKFQQLAAGFTDNSTLHPAFELLLRKGVFPYEFLDSWEKLDEPSLPPIAGFYSKLRQAGCSDADYAHAQRVWTDFKCSSLKQYMELYLKTDVLILADVFEEFRAVCLKNYGLDPAHYVSAPQLSWDAMLKLTSCSLELISDPEQYRSIDAGIRGGVSNITTRYARANNQYMTSYDSSKPSSYIIYLDANNLYGWAMSMPMPTGGFGWLQPGEFEHLDWLAQVEDQPQGYFIECDLDYPAELHERHNDYPLAPERLNLQVQMLSEQQVELLTHYKMPHSSWNLKLVPNLLPKHNYIVHYLNLQFYLAHGMKLLKVHRVLHFNQSRWLAPYISKNSLLRADAKNDFEKEFFKLMNNSIYGKTCENQKKRTDIKLVTEQGKCRKLTEKPHCMGFRIFDEQLVAIEMRKVKSLINKPFYVGFSVLELSKLHMYR
jgi:hypothetical protein